MSDYVKRSLSLSGLDRRIIDDAVAHAESILRKYSNSEFTETTCRTSDLLYDVSYIFARLLEKNRQQEEHHDAWLRITGQQERERSKSLLKRIFS